MREVVINVYCEFCWVENQSKIVATGSWTLGMHHGPVVAPPVKMIDVCDNHAAALDALYRVFQQAADEHREIEKVKPRVRAQASGETQLRADVAAKYRPDQLEICPVCESHLVGRTGLVTHIWNRHVPGGRPQMLDCPDCDFSAKSPQGIAAHRSTLHTYDPVADALAAVPSSTKLAAKLAEAS